MGLDMYFIAVPADQIINKISDTKFNTVINDLDAYHEIQYFRKHNQLNGWLEQLYYEKDGQGEFNCSTMILTIQDLDRLRDDIQSDSLPDAQGFFWGNRDITPEVKQQYMDLINESVSRIHKGEIVYYYPNW